jgi:hypothetical protein
MGVKHLVYYLVFAIDDEVDFYSCVEADIPSSSGKRPAHLMGVAPEAIFKFFIRVLV